MSLAFRRAIFLPPGIDSDAVADLQVDLTELSLRQNTLADESPHVLRFTDQPRVQDNVIWLEHEPASALDITGLFDRFNPPVDDQALLIWSAALFDALRLAHHGQVPLIHGGLCPGTLLRSEDGVEKISDFGFARAICAHFDELTYLHLSVGPDERFASTAVWQRLESVTRDRDDRISAFIDPHKLGEGSLRAFESRSDIWAAGLLLYLFAHHRHPYFAQATEAGAHRDVDSAQLMAMGLWPAGIRDELKRSTDPSMQTWCELVGASIARKPETRPSAEDAHHRLLNAGVKPRRLDDVLPLRQKRLIAKIKEMPRDHEAWRQLYLELRLLLESAATSQAFSGESEPYLELCRTMQELDGSDPGHQPASVSTLLSTSPLPGDLLEKVRGTAFQVNRKVAVERALDELRRLLREDDLKALPELLARLERMRQRLTALQHELAQVDEADSTLKEGLEALESRHAEVAELVGRMEERAAQALDALEAHARDGRWPELEEGLSELTSIQNWMEEAFSRANAMRASLDRYKEDERRREEVRQSLKRRLEQAESELAHDRFDEARDALDPVLKQETDGDLAERAAALRGLIESKAGLFRARQAEIEQARREADELLSEASAQAELGDVPSLDEATRILERVLAIDDLSASQRTEVHRLLEDIHNTREELMQSAEARLEELSRAESELDRASEFLREGRLLEAERCSSLLVDHWAPHVRDRATTVHAQVTETLTEIRTGLIARLDAVVQEITGDKALDDAAFDQASRQVDAVGEDPHADEEIRSTAHRLHRQIEFARQGAQAARRQAEEDRQTALGALEQLTLGTVRTAAQSILDNVHAGSDARREAEVLIAGLAPLEEANATIEAGEAPRAVALLSRIIEEQDETVCQPIREATERLRDRARRRAERIVVQGIHGHLERRARYEETSPGAGSFPTSQTLGDTVPGWVHDQLSEFETFVHDRCVAGMPLRPSQLLESGRKFGDKYEILEFLGSGGMGEVYRAKDLKLDREVALKLAPSAERSQTLAEALDNEAKAIAALSHPHIIHINSYGVLEGQPCFDTNYIHGLDLAQYADQHTLSDRECAELLVPIAEAVGYAHGKGVLHGDVKPQNIYVSAVEGEGPWLIDFGLARMRTLCKQHRNTGLSGTPGYIAPEVITSMGRQVDQRADIFGLGCVLYRLLAGRPPFHPRPAASSRDAHRFAGDDAPSVSRTLLNTLRQELTPLSRIAGDRSEGLRRICDRAMRPDPQERYQSAAEMADALRAFIDELDEATAADFLARAGHVFEDRRQHELAERDDLDEAESLAGEAHRIAKGPNRQEADRLLAQIRAARQAILDEQDRGRAELALARETSSENRWAAARGHALLVAGNPYVPDLHPEAQGIVKTSQEHIRRRARRRFRRLAVAVGACAAVALSLVISGVIPTSALKPSPAPIPPSLLSPSPEPPVITRQVRLVLTDENGTAIEEGQPVSLTQGTSMRFRALLETGADDAAVEFKVDKASESDEFLTVQQRDAALPGVFEIRALNPSSEAIPVTIRAATADDVGTRSFYVKVEPPPPSRLVLSPPAGEVTVDEGGYAPFEITLSQVPGREFSLIAEVTEGDSDRIHVGDSQTSTSSQGVLTLSGSSTSATFYVIGRQDDDLRDHALTLRIRSDGLPEEERPEEITVAVQVVDDDKDRIELSLAPAEGGAYVDGQEIPVDEGGSLDLKLALSHIPNTDVPVRFSQDPAEPVITLQMQSGQELQARFMGDRQPPVRLEIPPSPDSLADDVRLAITFTASHEGRDMNRKLNLVVRNTTPPWAEDIAPAAIAAGMVSSPGADLSGKGAWLVGYDADCVRIEPDTGGTQIGVRILDPWSRSVDIVEPLRVRMPRYPEKPITHVDDAVAHIRANLDDSSVQDSVRAYLGLQPERVRLGNELNGQLPQANTSREITENEAGRVLGAIRRVKWLMADPPGDVDMAQRMTELETALGGRSVRMGGGLMRLRCVEYFWGVDGIHALVWWRTPNNQLRIRHHRLAGPTDISSDGDPLGTLRAAMGLARAGQTPPQYDQVQTQRRRLGDALIRPILEAEGFLDASGAFGVAIAPDGPLCFVPLTMLPFTPTGGNLVVSPRQGTSTRTISSIARLSDLCSGDFREYKTAVWVLPSLTAPYEVFSADVLKNTWRVAGQALLDDVNPHADRHDSVNNALYLTRDLPADKQAVFSLLVTETPEDGAVVEPRLPLPEREAAPWFVLVADPVR